MEIAIRANRPCARPCRIPTPPVRYLQEPKLTQPWAIRQKRNLQFTTKHSVLLSINRLL